MALKLTKTELQVAIAKLFSLLGEGMSDEDARIAMGLNQIDFQDLRERMFKHKAQELKDKPSEHAYVEYLIAQRANLHDLTAMIENFKSTKQYNAMVGAVRARSDILNHLIAKGQEFGLLEKRPEEKRIVAGVMVAQLTNKQLQGLVTRELGQLNRMVELFGEGGDILEIEAGQVYRPDPRKQKQKALPPAASTPASNPRTNKAKTGKVHGGRRVIKQKKMKPGAK